VLSAVLTIFEIGRPWIFLKDAKGGAAAPPALPKSATGVTCRLTAKNRDQLRNPTLGNRVWATFTLLHLSIAFNSLYCFILILYLNTGKLMLAVFSTASRAQQTLIRPALDWKCENGKISRLKCKCGKRLVEKCSTKCSFFRILPLYFRFRISSVSLYLQSTVTRKNDRQKWKDFLKYKRRFSLARLHFGIWQSMLVLRCLTLNCPITRWYYVLFLALHTLLLDRRSRGRSRKRWIENIISRIWSK